MVTETNEWCYSFDNMDFHGGGLMTRKAAIHAARDEIEDGDESAGAVIYIARCKRFVPNVDADSVIEYIQDDAFSEAGDEATEGYLEGPAQSASRDEKEKWAREREDLSKRLTDAFNAWAKDTGNEPNFFVVDDESVERVILK